MKFLSKSGSSFLSLLFLFLLGGCVAQSDFDALPRDQENTSKELQALQRNISSLNTDLRGQLEDLKKRTADLRKEVGELKMEVKW